MATQFRYSGTVESSTFGAEFMALRIAMELISSLRYKLRMFGISVEEPANVFCDNKAVIKILHLQNRV